LIYRKLKEQERRKIKQNPYQKKRKKKGSNLKNSWLAGLHLSTVGESISCFENMHPLPHM